MNTTDTLSELAKVLQTRTPANGGDPEKSYVARLLSKGPDAFLKKIGEEATEVVMAAKDLEACALLAPHVLSQPLAAEAAAHAAREKFVGEVADLWFHSLIALTHYGLSPTDVLAELERRVGLSGLDEKALRKLAQRTQDEQMK